MGTWHPCELEIEVGKAGQEALMKGVWVPHSLEVVPAQISPAEEHNHQGGLGRAGWHRCTDVELAPMRRVPVDWKGAGK